MKTKQPKKLITAAAALAVIATTMSASAQTQTTDTRIGKLRFENGFPSEETIQLCRSSPFVSRRNATSALISTR